MKQGELFLSVCGTLKDTSSSDADSIVSTSTEATGQTPTEYDRHLENKTRMTINGNRYRVGNPNHPYHTLYKDKGFEAVYEAMGLIEGAATKIRKEVLALYDKHVGGEVYVIGNTSWPEWVKIGMAVDAMDRLKGYQTGSPFRDYKLLYSVSTNDRRKAEAAAHKAAEKIAERRGEWFKMSVGQAKECIQNGL